MVWQTAVALAFCGILTGCDNRPETRLVDEAHSSLTSVLRDPDSAKFNDAGVHAFPKLGLVCGGRVNSKNGFGGYSGEQPYYYQRGHGGWLGESEEAAPLVAACTQAYGNLAAELEAKGRPHT